MNTENRKSKTEIRAAEAVLDYVRDYLVVSMPYFNRALLFMRVRFSEADSPGDGEGGAELSADGEIIFADAGEVIRTFKKNPPLLIRKYLHMVFHCLFSHPFTYGKRNSPYFDAAADMAVEEAVLSLENASLSLPDDAVRRLLLDRLRQEVSDMTAERICHFFETHPREAAGYTKEAGLFLMDSHHMWPASAMEEVREIFLSRSAPESVDQKAGEWRKIMRTAGSENLSFRKGMGEKAGKRRITNLTLNRDDYDYSEFLLRFARETEVVEINPDEFDYIYYTYGLDLYGNMPLIEPLEYRDAKKIRDFVIAIDTSGSCLGQTVRDFLSKTWSLFCNSDVFTEKMNLLIIQCDCEIESEARIRSREEFTSYMNAFEIRGAGGTDFRPVFERVDALLKAGDLSDLRGLILFTDGLGRFPEQKPGYRTAVVFVGKQNETPFVPSWAETYRFAPV